MDPGTAKRGVRHGIPLATLIAAVALALIAAGDALDPPPAESAAPTGEPVAEPAVPVREPHAEPVAEPPEPDEPDEPPTVRVATSGSHSERLRAIPIAGRPRGLPRVVISLGPGKVGELRSGDRLEGRAEVEVSTTCLEPMPKCVGRRYSFSPRVEARIVLARGSARAQGPFTRPISAWRRMVCSQRQPARNHHCVLAIPSATRAIADASRLPCRRCHVNLVLSAGHPNAKRGQRLVVGVDDNGGVVQNKGQLATALFRPPEAVGLAARTVSDEAIRTRLPMGPDRSRAARRRVVYSVRLDDLRAGESLLVDAQAVAKIKHLRYNALVQAKLLLSTEPDAPRRGKAARIAGFEGRVGPQNGFNCTQGRSGHSDPCLVRKAGVIRILRDARERPLRGTGEPIPLYMNLVLGTRAVGVHSHLHRSHHHARVRGGQGFLRVERYGPETSR